jgi:hypothetical protein
MSHVTIDWSRAKALFASTARMDPRSREARKLLANVETH